MLAPNRGIFSHVNTTVLLGLEVIPVPFSEMVDFMSKSKNQNSSPMYVVNRSEKVDIDFSHNICCFCNDLPLKLENLGAHALIE